jgi:hypothetical protein
LAAIGCMGERRGYSKETIRETVRLVDLIVLDQSFSRGQSYLMIEYD